jgi:Flp pilus assembly pilin Flp
MEGLSMSSVLTRSGWNFLRANSGVTAIEYALIAAGMGIATAVGANILGPTVSENFGLVAETLDQQGVDASLVTTSVSPLKE